MYKPQIKAIIGLSQQDIWIIIMNTKTNTTKVATNDQAVAEVENEVVQAVTPNTEPKKRGRKPGTTVAKKVADTPKVAKTVKGVTKEQREVLKAITQAVHKAPRGGKLSMLHILTIKHNEEIGDITAKAFCAATKLPKAYGIEFIRLSNITDRLKSCGLDTNKL